MNCFIYKAKLFMNISPGLFLLNNEFWFKKRAFSKRLWLFFFISLRPRERQTSWCYKPQRILFERQRGLETSTDKNARPQKREPSRRHRRLSTLSILSTYAIFFLARLSLFLLKIKVVILKSRLPGATAEAHTHSLTPAECFLSMKYSHLMMCVCAH